MPSHVYNKLEIYGPIEDVKCIKEQIAGDNGPIDFDKIVPMPEFISTVVKGSCKINGHEVRNWISENGKNRKLTDEEQAIIDEHGDWYDWSIRYWGTKWNAYSQNVILDEPDDGYGSGSLVLEFSTAWSAPEPVIYKLRYQFPDVSISGYYVGEGNEFAGVF